MNKQVPPGGDMRVDLSIGKIKKESIDPKLLDQYIGGSELGVRLLCEETIPGSKSVRRFESEST